VVLDYIYNIIIYCVPLTHKEILKKGNGTVESLCGHSRDYYIKLKKNTGV